MRILYKFLVSFLLCTGVSLPTTFVSSHALAPESRLEEVEEATKLLTRITPSPEEVIASRLLPPAEFRRPGQLETLALHIKSQLQHYEGTQIISYDLDAIAEKTPVVWDPENRFMAKLPVMPPVGAFVLQLVAFAEESGQTHFRLREGISLKDFYQAAMFLPNGEFVDVRIPDERGSSLDGGAGSLLLTEYLDRFRPEKFSFRSLFARRSGPQDHDHRRQAIGYLVSAGKEGWDLAFAADLLEDMGLISPGAWKLLLATDAWERNTEASNTQTAYIRKVRARIYRLLGQLSRFMGRYESQKDLHYDIEFLRILRHTALTMNWQLGDVAGLPQLMLPEEALLAYRSPTREKNKGVLHLPEAPAEPTLSTSTDIVVYQPGILQTDVVDLLEGVLVGRVKELIEAGEHEHAALLLFIGEERPEEFRKIATFLRSEVWILYAAFILGDVHPSLAAHFLMQATRMQERALGGLGWKRTVLSEEAVAWAVKLLRTLDQEVHRGKALETPAGEIAWRLLTHPRLQAGRELMGKVLQRALSDRGRHYEDWELGFSLYHQLHHRLGEFGPLLYSENEVVQTGLLLRSRIPKPLHPDESFLLTEDQEIARILDRLLIAGEHRTLADILLLKLSPIRAYALIKQVLVGGAYKGDVEEDMAQVLAAAQPWVAARFLSEIHRSSGKSDKGRAHAWILERLAGMHREVPALAGGLSPASRILMEMMTRPSRLGGNADLAASFFDPVANDRYLESAQEIYDEVYAVVPGAVDLHTFYQTKKLFTKDLTDTDKKRMVSYWGTLLVPVRGNMAAAEEAAKALGRLGTTEAIGHLIRQADLLSRTTAEDLGISDSDWEQYRDRVSGALAENPAELAWQLVLRFKATKGKEKDPWKLGYVPGASAEDNLSWQNTILERMSRQDRFTFLLHWIRSQGDNDVFKRLVSWIKKTYPDQREIDLLETPIRKIWNTGNEGRELDSVDVLSDVRTAVGDRAVSSLLQAFRVLYLEPLRRENRALDSATLTETLNMLFYLDVYDITLSGSEIQLLSDALKKPPRFMGRPVVESAIETILQHNRDHVHGEGLPQAGIRAHWAFEALSETKVQDRLYREAMAAAKIFEKEGDPEGSWASKMHVPLQKAQQMGVECLYYVSEYMRLLAKSKSYPETGEWAQQDFRESLVSALGAALDPWGSHPLFLRRVMNLSLRDDKPLRLLGPMVRAHQGLQEHPELFLFLLEEAEGTHEVVKRPFIGSVFDCAIPLARVMGNDKDKFKETVRFVKSYAGKGGDWETAEKRFGGYVEFDRPSYSDLMPGTIVDDNFLHLFEVLSSEAWSELLINIQHFLEKEILPASYIVAARSVIASRALNAQEQAQYLRVLRQHILDNKYMPNATRLKTIEIATSAESWGNSMSALLTLGKALRNPKHFLLALIVEESQSEERLTEMVDALMGYIAHNRIIMSSAYAWDGTHLLEYTSVIGLIAKYYPALDDVLAIVDKLEGVADVDLRYFLASILKETKSRSQLEHALSSLRAQPRTVDLMGIARNEAGVQEALLKGYGGDQELSRAAAERVLNEIELLRYEDVRVIRDESSWAHYRSISEAHDADMSRLYGGYSDFNPGAGPSPPEDTVIKELKWKNSSAVLEVPGGLLIIVSSEGVLYGQGEGIQHLAIIRRIPHERAASEDLDDIVATFIHSIGLSL